MPRFPAEEERGNGGGRGHSAPAPAERGAAVKMPGRRWAPARYGGGKPALPGRRFNLRPGGCLGDPRSSAPLNAHTSAVPEPGPAREGLRLPGAGCPARPPPARCRGAPLPQRLGRAGSAAPSPSCPLPACSALPGSRSSGNGSLDRGPCESGGTWSPRRGCAGLLGSTGSPHHAGFAEGGDKYPPRRPCPAGEGRGTNSARASADNYLRGCGGRRGSTRRGRCPRAARPQSPRGRGRSPGQRRTAVHGGWQNPRGGGDSAPQRKAT